MFPPCYLRSTRVARGIVEGETEDNGDANEDTDNDIDTEEDTEDDSDSDRGDGDGDGDAPDVYLAKSHDLRKGFLSELSDDEVVEMWQIYNFMVFASVRIQYATSDPRTYDRRLRICIHFVPCRL